MTDDALPDFSTVGAVVIACRSLREAHYTGRMNPNEKRAECALCAKIVLVAEFGQRTMKEAVAAGKLPVIVCNQCAKELAREVREGGGKMELKMSGAAKESLERSQYSRDLLDELKGKEKT